MESESFGMAKKLEVNSEPSLPRRDWIMLPLLALLTVVILAFSSEKISEILNGKPKSSVGACLDLSHPERGISGIPNCQMSERDYGVPSVQYKFDSCGYRSEIGCESKHPGSYQMVMIGTSIAFGQWVTQRNTIAARIPIDIARTTGRKIYLYNEGMLEQYPQFVAAHVSSALSRKPDMILWIVTPHDISIPPLDPRDILLLVGGTRDKVELVERWKGFLRIKIPHGSFSSLEELLSVHFVRIFSQTNTGVLLQNILNKNQERYVQSYLKLPDSESGYLKLSPSSAWKTDINAFENMAATMIKQSRAAGVPLVVTLVPTRAQAAMLSSGVWPDGYDPYAIDNDVRSIITRHGGIYVDIFPDLKQIPNLETHFYFSNGHPDDKGDAILAQAISKELTSGQIPTLNVVGNAQQIQKAEK